MSIEHLRDEITSLASQIDAPLILEDDRQRLVAHSPHHAIQDEPRRGAIMARSLPPELIEWCEQWGIRTAEQAVRTPRDDAIGILARVCVPVRRGPSLLGFIWAVDDPPLSDDAIEALEETAKTIAVQMHRDQVALAIRSELLLGLVSNSAEQREMCAQDAAVQAELRIGADAVVMLVRSDSVDDIDAIIRRHDSRAFRFTTTKEVVVLSQEPNPNDLRSRRLAVAILAESEEDWKPAIGLSELSTSPTKLHLAYRQASNAALVAATIPTEGRITQWGRLGPYRLLSRAATAADSEEFDDPRLARVRDDPELLLTLETYLDLACSAKAAAEALHIHRATLYYRLEKIESLAGADLRSGADRLSFHNSVKLLRLRGDPPSPGDDTPGSSHQ